MCHSKKIRTIIILMIVVFLCFYVLAAARRVQQERIAEFNSRYVLWQAENPEAEQKIKGYIDNIDWGYYINEFAKALVNPVETFRSLSGEYGVDPELVVGQ